MTSQLKSVVARASVISSFNALRLSSSLRTGTTMERSNELMDVCRSLLNAIPVHWE